jgi:5'-nucleotidase/UDP-sugar diphosphatase
MHRNRNNWHAVVATVLAAAAAGTSLAGTKGSFTLTLLHNNDGESKLISASASQPDFGGIARFATVVANAKAAAPGGVLMLTSGDNFLAGAQWDCSLSHGVPYYDSIALNLIGYDALCLGNHDFDFGPDVLANFIEGFAPEVPFLSANLDVSPEPALAALAAVGRIAPSTLLEIEGRLVGVVGATTTQLPFISSPGDVIVNPDVQGAVQAQIDDLIAAGAKVIVLTSHLQSVTEDLALVPTLRGVDIAIAGGGDDLLANPGTPLLPGDTAVGPYPILVADADGRTVPVVTTTGDYRYLGRLEATFDAAGELVSINPDSGPIRVLGGDYPDAVTADPTIQALVVDPVETCVAELASNVIAENEVPLDGRTSQVRSRETNEGNLCADALRWQASQLAATYGVPEPQVALQNGGGIRNNSIVPVGPFTELDSYGILPFANFVSVFPEVPVETFKAVLENAVSRIAPPPGAPTSGSGRFAQVSGFRFTYNVDLPPGSRVTGVVLDNGPVVVSNGMVVEGAEPITVATIDFLARGGDQYPFGDLPFVNLGVTYQQALENFVIDGLGGVISAEAYPVEGQGRIVRLDNPADLNDDSVINAADLAILLGLWGSCDPDALCPGDLDGDQMVGASDVTVLLASWTL